MRSLLFSLLLLSSVLHGTSVAEAYEHTVMPMAINLDVAKRDIITETITLSNNSDRQVRLYASVNEVSTDREGILESFEAPSMTNRTITPTSWIEITRGRIEIPAGETVDIPLTIRMNPNTKPGKYSVFIGFAAASNVPQATQKVRAGNAPGTLINLTVDENQNQFLRLTRFATDRFITSSDSGEVSYILSNPSSVDVIHKGELIFYSSRGIEVGSVNLNTPNNAIAPSSDEEFTVSVPDGLGWGKYKAFLSVEYGENLTASVNDTSFFYMIPLWQLIALFIFLLMIAFIITLSLHRRQMHEVEDHGSLPLYIQDGESHPQDHDVNLRH